MQIFKDKDAEGFEHRKFFLDDTSNNYLYIKQNDRIILLFLKLGSEKKMRRIGRATKSTKTIEMNREREKHLFRKLNAYGFCYYTLKYQSSYEWVRLSDDTGCHWKIPIKFILENGQFLNFKKEGFETQQFVPLEKLEQFKINKSENRRI